MRLRWAAILAVLLIDLTVAGCGGESTPLPLPAPVPIPDAPILSCPVDVEIASTDGQPVPVEFPDPTVQGGAPPVTVRCSGVRNELFPIGTTSVTCTGVDAYGRTSSCSFRVIVAAPPPPPPPPPPRLTVTKFLAFGDSLTEGKTALASGVLMLTLPDAYTFKLQDLLARRYTTQAFSVVNEGLGGESTLQGKRRLPGTLASLQPEVVLLMEGANDLLAFGNNGVRDAIDNLGDMISLGQSAGARVLIATLPPQRPDSLRGTAAAVVPAFNDGIRHIAAQQNAVLVDVFAAFRGDLSLVGPDGLHLNELGYQRIAEAFFDVIRTRFELTPQTRVHYGDFSIRAAR